MSHNRLNPQSAKMMRRLPHTTEAVMTLGTCRCVNPSRQYHEEQPSATPRIRNVYTNALAIWNTGGYLSQIESSSGGKVVFHTVSWNSCKESSTIPYERPMYPVTTSASMVPPIVRTGPAIMPAIKPGSKVHSSRTLSPSTCNHFAWAVDDAVGLSNFHSARHSQSPA